MNISEIKQETYAMIDDLKSACNLAGAGNSPGEYKIITQSFLYKFLNDKFIYDLGKNVPEFQGKSNKEIESLLKSKSDEEYEIMLLSLDAGTAVLGKEQLISTIFSRKGEEDFHNIFDKALEEISKKNMEIFSVHTGGKAQIKLFSPISREIADDEKKDSLCSAIIQKLATSSFENVFEQKYDFFADIFEYLIKDYNKDSGRYAEYYTPHVIAGIIAKIMAPEGATNVTVYDPSAGTGTLVLAMAHQIGEEHCTIYTQDITQKSNEFMRLNLILNNLVHSLPNVIQDDTLLYPRHLNKKKTDIEHFDFIVSNPPFNVDFSETRDELAGSKYNKRFWAGVPNVPNKDKSKMAIYLMFLQHIIDSMKEDGKAAIVVPTGFLTAGSGIQKKIRDRIIRERMLKGVISMPSNIFATTGTNVSIIFLDKSNKDGDVVLMDASNLGTKEKIDGKYQKTVLSDSEIRRIIDIFIKKEPVDDFSVVVKYEDIEKKKLSFSAGQYFEVKIDYVELTPQEFTDKMNNYMVELQELFDEGAKLQKEIIEQLKKVNYEQNNNV
ncbi:HsdM family class I SAM-dependent methyltransferase [Pseudobutyrivibrio xylanivorans]|uniref:site-specific DNA-methyltransferase (adenine-specific) n=1 Tax=Pseudobutyrivibrio xylanivorans TaxID=185007 RepID=A0A5P6VLB5_PSEXY|nr:class I SAM-dependent DNA methyltransferase [Pseudobutyrivibrio xylanivorans]QFJ53379.1 SAM-dependent DNA methyltransferase [Pseudobutyrivibrio xylanivorans]QFJ53456.1 SAM-dependent DNA methyltransferase [Pseudobutyrivibrio xylanivorans]